MKAIILCAGAGERMRPLTDTIPKPMIPIANKPVLEYLVNLCKKHGINEICINTSYLPEKIKNYFGDGSNFGVSLKYSFEDNLLGTAGALNNFREFLSGSEPFFVIYGDNITDLNLTKMLQEHKLKDVIASLFVYRGEKQIDSKTTPGCILLDDKSEVMEIIERPTEEQAVKLSKIEENRKAINAGIYILEPEILKLIPEGFSDFSRDVLPKALENGKIYGHQDTCYFKEVGQMMRYLKAKEDIESGRVKLNI